MINHIVKMFLIFNVIQIALSQSILNPSPTKKIILERFSFFNKFGGNEEKKGLGFSYNFYSYLNTNLPNLENNNGLYIPKGYGLGSSYLVSYTNKNIFISMEPEINNVIDYSISAPKKESYFHKLNDNPIDKSVLLVDRLKNSGIKFRYKKISIGYGNWDQWWGPGIHNSLVLSNNAKSFNYIFFNNNKSLNRNLSYRFNFFVSDAIQNTQNNDFYLSAYSLIINYKNIELGRSKHILSGGYENIYWSKNEAILAPFKGANDKYWDQITDYYLSMNFPESRLKIFFELGIPKRSFGSESNSLIFPDHSVATIFGFRKYGLLDIDELLFGFEYTSTLMSQYYYKIPSYNWYGSHRYDYSSFLGRRWGAHSGTDSDDFLVFLGYLSNTGGLIYELNYERHGVSYNFPPEVKLESRVSVNYQYKNLYLSIIYENEYFEHYAFVDKSINVWDESFEPGSIQRTSTLLLCLEYTIY